MATINIGYRLFAGSEAEAKQTGLPHLENLWKRLQEALKLVEEDCLMRFPDLIFEVPDFDAESIDIEERDEEVGETSWELMYFTKVITISPDGIPECDYSFDVYDRWRNLGQPMYKDVCEPLYYCDWSSVKPMCGATYETMGDLVSVEFETIKAVDSYYGGIHFYSDTMWL
jgi:hypothetical protein